MNQTDWRTYNLTETYHFFIANNGKSDEDTYKKARFGVTIVFDILNYTTGFGMLPKEKLGKVRVDGKWYSKIDINTELEEREILMKEWLEQNMEVDGYGNTQPRLQATI